MAPSASKVTEFGCTIIAKLGDFLGSFRFYLLNPSCLFSNDKANGDHNKVWQSHCTDRKSLEEYASAMYMLAVNHWTRQSPEGRVEWCYSMAVEFFSGGGLKKLKEKQKRRRQFSETVNKCCCCFDSEESEICPSAR